MDFHGEQDGEYEALNFARSLDDEKALLSISMGLPQILGSNSKLIGYDSVQEMFNNFNKGQTMLPNGKIVISIDMGEIY